MSRSPTPWLLGDIPHDRISAPAIGHPRLRLNQLQPGGCTQLHHLNEAMPFRTAGRTSSSWSHRRAPTYLRRSHMPLDGTYKHLPLQEWHSVASGCPLEQKVHEGPDYAIAGIAANEQRDISAAAFCCEALSRPPVVTNS